MLSTIYNGYEDAKFMSELKQEIEEKIIKHINRMIPENTKHPFEEITNKMFETYLKKNKDYGNSFDKSLDKWGLTVAAIRLGDKLNRFESFIKNRTLEVEDEGIIDTLMDLSCYSIMTIMYLNAKRS